MSFHLKPRKERHLNPKEVKKIKSRNQWHQKERNRGEQIKRKFFEINKISNKPLDTPLMRKKKDDKLSRTDSRHPYRFDSYWKDIKRILLITFVSIYLTAWMKRTISLKAQTAKVQIGINRYWKCKLIYSFREQTKNCPGKHKGVRGKDCQAAWGNLGRW